MEVDHLRAEVDRTDLGALVDFETERSIERDHGVHVLHRQGDVIEAADTRSLGEGPGFGGRPDRRVGGANADRVLDECPS